MIYIFTKKEAALKSAFPKNAEFLPAAKIKHSPQPDDICYLDISGFTGAAAKEAVAQLKKCCKNSWWGIIDPKGSVKDPSEFFFDGASDYLGPDFFKGSKAVDPKRLKKALQWRLAFSGEDAKAGAKSAGQKQSGAKAGLPKNGIKFPPASSFPGWKGMKTGKTLPFYLLYCSVQGKVPLNTRLGERAYAALHQYLSDYLDDIFYEADAHLWLDSGKDLLFLLPPKPQNAKAAITACIRALASAPLVAMENLALSIPVNFVFTLHYGAISYSPPGKTGKVISDAVNYVFHLGPKKAQTGRLTISDQLPDGSVPKELEDCFISAGGFEGYNTWHTKKFSYAKPWV